MACKREWIYGPKPGRVSRLARLRWAIQARAPNDWLRRLAKASLSVLTL